MSALSSSLRKQLETSVLAARRAAESASRATIDGLGVFVDRRPEHLDADQSLLRNGLRAKWRQLGGDRELLIAECAYEQWHRLLFARFLAENSLLLHPKYKAPVTLVDCEDLAGELGEPDAWSVAARFAAEILPGIFRLDDPCVRLRLAPEGRYALEQILDALPADTFAADDALGWVYQFWQKDKKDEVNASERKICGADLGPVTQLFTESYMVRFLLENSLGAWWAARHPDSQLVKGFDYLRLRNDGRPAAGSFDRWPDRVAGVTVMDPCCGSGHFLVEAFSMLWQMRAEEEGVAPVAAQDAVLRDNLFGLELDPRCVQIAMFAVALQAWKTGGGWRQLPVPNIACSGIPVKAPVEEWQALAGAEPQLQGALGRLHSLFSQADSFGSLIDPRQTTETNAYPVAQGSFDDVAWDEIAPLLGRATASDRADPVTRVLGADAAAVARAADLLSRRYTVITTNVPYLSKAKQSPILRDFIARYFAESKGDLATTMLARLEQMTQTGGSFGAVLPEKLLSLGTYQAMRESLLSRHEWNLVALMGARAFQTPMFDLGIILGLWSKCTPSADHAVWGIDVRHAQEWRAKQQLLATQDLVRVRQAAQFDHPEARFSLESVPTGPLLELVADSYTGSQTGDFARYGRQFWELPLPRSGWSFQMTSVAKTTPYGGREHVIQWDDGNGALSVEPGAYIRGKSAWGRAGVLVSRMGRLPVTLYSGEFFDDNAAVVVPKDASLLPALWAFCTSSEYVRLVRIMDNTVKVTNRTLAKVPFDIDRWRRVGEEADPLPEPWSDDPTQWLFEGRPEVSTAPLQVAVGRLVGFRWPEQAESDDHDATADAHGIVCLPSVAGEAPAAERLQRVLAAAFGERWSPATVKELLEQAGSKKKNLSDWLRDEFFKQHCALFGNRPFVWHVWDGQLDGFAALVNYHRLDRKTLEKLTYTYLGQDWVERQRAEVRDEVTGAEARLSAALGLQRKLEAILEGEAPYDIYVRWKDTQQQPIGWEPDLNDGVRLNVRPFAEAGVLRSPFNVHWRKDRGKNPDGSERENDRHLALGDKLHPRKQAGRA